MEKKGCGVYTCTTHKIIKYLLMTKLAILFIFAISAQSFANSYSQGISLKLDRVQLRKVFRVIEEQGIFRFVYKDEILPKNKRVSIQVHDASLEEVMGKILENTSLSYKMLNSNLVVITDGQAGNAYDQPPVHVKGIVTNSKGEPIEGVSVEERNTRNGTVTKNDGSFSLDVLGNDAVLVFSHVGFSRFEMTVNNRRQFNITLQETGSNLNDVIVIGYGERRRRDVTGAVSTVSAKDIEKSTSMSPELALQGTAAGVLVQSGGGEPNARPTVRIRGVNTFGYADPLYVVDGVPIYEGGAGITDGGIGDIRSPINIFTLINPDDIESISVLKDASAAAIYGVRASNGVVLITTKKGKTGRPKVEVSTYYGMQNIPKKISVLNTKQYFDLVTEAYNNNPDKDNSGVDIPIGQNVNFGPIYDPASSQYMGNNPTYDWTNALLNKNASLQDHSVRVSGGSENTTYYVSAGYTKTESPLKANNLQRYSLSANVDSKISKIIQTGMTLRLSQENALTNTQADQNTMLATIPFQPIYDKTDPTGYAPVATGTFVANPDYDPTLLNPGAPFIFATGPSLLYGKQSRFNVFAFQALNNTQYELYNALGNAYVQIEPIPGLKLKGTIGGQYYFNLRKQWGNNDSWRFSQTPGNPYSGQDGNSKGTYGERQGRTTNLNKELTLDYTHTFKDHHLDVLLSASNEFARWVWTDLTGQVNYADPQFRNISNQPPFTQGSSGILQEDALIGYLGRVSYKYKDKYYLDGTLRYDGSSRLAPGHKWDKFPSFGAAWRISSEDFFPKNSFINDLKIRGGWGILGNYQSAGYYEFLSNVSLTPDYPLGSGNGDPYGQQLQGAALPGFANTTLTWEKVKSTSFGFDALLFNSHVSFTAEYYNKTTDGIIQAVALPPNTGIQNPADLNIASVRNSGIELQLGYNNQFGQVDFNVAGNFTTVNNKVLKLSGGTPFGNEFGRIQQGYPIDYLWGYKVGGIFQSQDQINTWRQTHADATLGQTLADPAAGYKYQPGDMYFQDLYSSPRTGMQEQHGPAPDSVISSNDRTYLGKTIPGYSYGLSIGAGYKNFDISILFQGVGDVQRVNSLRAGLESMSGLANQDTKTLGRWEAGHPSSTMPRAVYNDPANNSRAGSLSNQFIENAGYMRLKNLTIGYSLPKTFLQKLGFVQNFRIYASGLNLLTVTKWTGYDPEADSGSGVNGNNVIPTTRQFLFGIKAIF
ncbi:MAG: TonB-dependent receptor [Bacteroidota bacterium]|nr:TonB-dependent receptor [Bacteroidota bacterium]